MTVPDTVLVSLSYLFLAILVFILAQVEVSTVIFSEGTVSFPERMC